MELQGFTICSNSKNHENYICTHKDCLSNSKKQLHCYSCLTKIHRDKKQNVKHIDQFQQVDKIMYQVQMKQQNISEFLTKLQDQCIEYHKLKTQQIENYPFFSQQQVNLIEDQIKNKLNLFLDEITNQLSKIQNCEYYSQKNHNQIFDLYFMDEQLIYKKLRELQVQFYNEIYNLLSQIDISIIYKDQFKQLEKRIIKCENRSFFKQFQTPLIFLIIFYLIFTSSQNLDNSTIFDIPKQIESIKLYNQQIKADLLEIKNQYVTNQSNQQQQYQFIQNQIEQLNKQQNTVFSKLIQSIKELENKYILQNINLNEKQDNILYKSGIQNIFLGKIHSQVPYESLNSFQKIFDQTFNTKLKFLKLQEIYENMKNTTMICVGGTSINSLTIELMACDFAYQIFSPTESFSKARKSESGSNLYWYMVPSKSFGFSNEEKIDLRNSDDYDQHSQYRFSHLLDNEYGGGRRIGNLTTLSYSPDHKLLIYALNN